MTEPLTPERRRELRKQALEVLPRSFESAKNDVILRLLEELDAETERRAEAEADRDLYRKAMNASLVTEQEVIRQLGEARAQAVQHADAYEARIAELEAALRRVSDIATRPTPDGMDPVDEFALIDEVCEAALETEAKGEEGA